MKGARFLAAAALLATAIAADWQISRGMELSAVATEAQRTPFREFPSTVGTWSVDTYELTARQMELLSVDDYLRADFASSGSGAISVYVGYYRNPDRATQHPPTICYPGSGWVQSYDTTAALKAPGSARLTVKETVFERGTEKQLVVYWYSASGYVGADVSWQKWARLKRLLSGGAPAGASKIQIAIPIETTREAAEKRLEAFLGDFVPALDGFIPQDTEKRK